MDAQTSPKEELPFRSPNEKDRLSSVVTAVVSALRRRWMMLAAIVLVIFGTSVIAVLMMTPKYTAVARIKIDPSQSAALGQLNEQAGSPDQMIVDTEVSVMQSLDVARAVVMKEKLFDDREFSANLPDATGPKAFEERIDGVARALLSAMTAQREKSTYIVELGIQSSDREKAARIANSFAQQYIDASLGRRSGTAERQADFLSGQLKQLSQKAAAADSRLAQYRAAAGVIAPTAGNVGGSTVTGQQIAPLAGQYATAQSEAAAAAAKVRAAERQISSGGIGAVSAVLNSDVIRALRDQRARLLQSQGEILTRYGPKHPESLKIAEQLKSVDEQINEEAQRIIAGLRADAESASARAQSLSGDLSVLRRQQASDTRSSAVAETYQREADAAQAAYNRLAERVQTSDQAARSSLSQAQIIEQATPPARPSKPKVAMLLGVGLLVALIVGIGAVAVMELVSSTLLTVADVQGLGLPMLGTTLGLSKAQLAKAGPEIETPADYIVAKPVAAYSEAFRTLRSALAVGPSPYGRVIAIVSTLPGEGKTTSALSLARVMAMAGDRTLLIDTDLRRAGLTKAAGIKTGIGLVEVLRGEVPAEAAIVPDKVENLDILPVAQLLFTPQDLFSGTIIPDLLAELRQRYDHIVIDTPPLLGVADARVIAGMADVVALIVRWNSTPRNAVLSGLEMLAFDHANIAGVVLSIVDKASESYGGLYYTQKYAKYYKDAD